MRTKLVVFLTLLNFLIVPRVSFATTIFLYTGQPYISNSNPALLGTHLTGFVSLNCSGVCPDGVYRVPYRYVPNHPLAIGYAEFTSGSVSVSVEPNQGYEFAQLTLVNNEVTDWDFSIFSIWPPGPGSGGTYIHTWRYYDKISDPLDNASANNYPVPLLPYTQAGTWSSAVVPWSPIGSGIPGLLLAIAGLVYWARCLREKARAAGKMVFDLLLKRHDITLNRFGIPKSVGF